MKLFNHEFQELDESHIRDLFSLEREGVVYDDHWIDDLNDFRHVKITLTQDEIQEYVRSLWAYEIFLRAGAPLRAADVPGIPPDIAERADLYVIHTSDGGTEGPPYHCPAGFMGPDLEALLCFEPGPRRVVLEELGSQAMLTTIKRAVDSLTPAIRRFNKREKGLCPWPVDREDDVRDLLYAMLRASIEDIQAEKPVPSRAGRHRFVDLKSASARLFIELKWIGAPGQWKRVVDEIAVDTQSYARDPDCRTLVFVILDAVRDIPDPREIERDLTGVQTIEGRPLDIHTFVREP
jgi:hypothetical protein